MGNEDIVVDKDISRSPRNGSDITDFVGLKTKFRQMTVEDKENIGENENKGIDFLQILPMELIEEIFFNLNPKELAACAAVSTSWREAVNSNKIWGFLCEKKGWKDDFDSHFTHLYNAHQQFRKWAHSHDSFSPICEKRLLYNKHVCLHYNWKWGKYVVHKISNGSQSFLQLFEPVACDGRYLVMQEKSSKFNQASTLVVWSLNSKNPKRLCNLPLPDHINPVDAIAFDYGTIAVAQSWVIIAYHLKDNLFVEAFKMIELSDLEPKNKLPKSMKTISPFLKITEDYIVSVPSHSHSSESCLPIFFWDRLTGELKHTLNFDSMYYVITNAEWFGDTGYLSLNNKKKKTYQVVEFGLKSATWEPFSQNVTVEIEKLAVSNQYLLAVTKTSNPSLRGFLSSRGDSNKELWLWDRTTGSALKTFDAQGKGFQFVNDYLMYFDSSCVTVINPKTPDAFSEFKVSGTISSIRAAQHPSIMVIVKTGCYIELWDWGRGCLLYTVTAETRYGSQLWCDDKRIITYHSSESAAGGGILMVCFW